MTKFEVRVQQLFNAVYQVDAEDEDDAVQQIQGSDDPAQGLTSLEWESHMDENEWEVMAIAEDEEEGSDREEEETEQIEKAVASRDEGAEEEDDKSSRSSQRGRKKSAA